MNATTFQLSRTQSPTANSDMTSPKDLLNVTDLSRENVLNIFDRASFFSAYSPKTKGNLNLLEGFVLTNLFLEPSTRTQTSFSLAGRRLGAHVIDIAPQSSSLQKGESEEDTARTLDAMGSDFLVIRHARPNAPHEIASQVKCSVINAGDGPHAHPTQALLDAFTIFNAFGPIDGLRIAICGDVRHSRVALSNALLLKNILGADVRFVGPESLTQREEPEVQGIEAFSDMREGLEGCDVVMALRFHGERRTDGDPLFTPQTYFPEWGLTHEKLGWAKPSAKIMHPGPFIRHFEISSELADDPERSLILKQIQNGVHIRMAVLEFLARNQDSNQDRNQAKT